MKCLLFKFSDQSPLHYVHLKEVKPPYPNGLATKHNTIYIQTKIIIAHFSENDGRYFVLFFLIF